MGESKKCPGVGVGVMIQNEKGEVLLGLRKSSHGAGGWCFPGGHVEFGETIFQCAERETAEETGLTVKAQRVISISENMEFIESHGKHYITIGVEAEYLGGSPSAVEPESFVEWKWFDYNKLPENLVFSAAIYYKNNPKNLLTL